MIDLPQWVRVFIYGEFMLPFPLELYIACWIGVWFVVFAHALFELVAYVIDPWYWGDTLVWRYFNFRFARRYQ